MRHTWTRLVGVLTCSSLLTSCSVALSGPRASSASIVGPEETARRPANEVLLKLKDDGPVRGKLIGIDGQEIVFLPSPYWNIPTRTIPLDDIVTIEVLDVHGSKKTAAGVSFVTGFVVTGALCGAGAEYDQDYTDCLVGASAIGLAASLVGLTVGAIKDHGRPAVYRFDGMEPGDKVKAIQRLVAR